MKTIKEVISDLQGIIVQLDSVQHYTSTPQPYYILLAICQVFKIEDPSVIRSSSRRRRLVLARTVLASHLREQGLSLTDIAAHINRHHTTVVHLLQQHHEWKRHDPEYRRLLKLVESALLTINQKAHEEIHHHTQGSTRPADQRHLQPRGAAHPRRAGRRVSRGHSQGFRPNAPFSPRRSQIF